MLEQFKSFLLNENKHYLGQRSGDILTALQNLQEDAPNMGSRALIRACQGIVNQIRRILHGRWDEEDIKYLKQLQKVGVALMVAIDEDGDLQSVVVSGTQELQDLLNKLEVPINSLGSEGAPPAEELPPLDQGSEIEA